MFKMKTEKELKTLKDIQEVELILTVSGKIIEKVVSGGYVSKEKLKQEAIKWIKELKTYKSLPKMNILGGRHIKHPRNRNIIDVNDKWDLAGNVTKYGMPDLVVVLGCSAGKGGSYDKDGRRVNNLANMIADVFRAPTIAMNTNTQIQYFIFNDDSTVKNAIFHHYSAPPEIYYP